MGRKALVYVSRHLAGRRSMHAPGASRWDCAWWLPGGGSGQSGRAQDTSAIATRGGESAVGLGEVCRPVVALARGRYGTVPSWLSPSPELKSTATSLPSPPAK